MESFTDTKVVGRRALIGRGFLGSVLDQPGRWTDRYNSTNIHTMSGHYDLIVIAAPSAKKWEVNERPAVDQYQIDRLTTALDQVTAKRVVLLSTIDATRDHPYGKHRRALEEYVLDRAGSVMRLPALYGDGLRKNALWDLLHGRPIANQRYIWYPVSHLWDDLLACRLGLTELYGAPLTMAEIADALHIIPKWLPYDPKADYNEEASWLMASQEAIRDIVSWATSKRLPATSPQSEGPQDQAFPQAES